MNVTLQPNPDDLSENQALHMAKLAEAAERYEEMTQYMNRSVKDTKGDDLTVEQRNLISVGYKNLMSARRTAWRVTQQQVDADEENKEQGEAYKEKIADELGDLINDVRTKVVEKFVKGPHAATDSEVLVFFHKVRRAQMPSLVTAQGLARVCTTTAEEPRSRAATLVQAGTSSSYPTKKTKRELFKRVVFSPPSTT